MKNKWTYFKFVMLSTIKRRAVWITWLLFLLTIISYLIIFPAISRANPLQLWANTTMAVCQTMLGMNVALFTSVLGIHIFREGYEEGTELIVISKPISRMGIILNKFLTFGCYCLIVNLSAVVITLFTYFIPSMDKTFYWSLVGSMFIGNLVSFGIFGSIAILLSVRFAKTGVIIVNMLIALILIIFQILSLFVFSTPLKTLVDHGVTPQSYIIQDRNVETGEYSEKNLVEFNTNAATQLTLDENERNNAINADGMKNYWTDTILKKDPSKILNVFDIGNQVALSYLSNSINEYSFRQAKRNLAFSRFYNYELTSPASQEIMGSNGKPTFNWVYARHVFYFNDDKTLKIIIPQQFIFPGISNSNSTRLRGYGNKLPVGYISESGKKLATKDVMFEPKQWKKYWTPFNLICDNLWSYDLYKEFTAEWVKTMPEHWYVAWTSTPQALSKYYQLLWSCFTGHSSEPQYFGNNFLKDYDQNYFDIQTVDDLNERFIQFKYFTYYRLLQEQNNILYDNSELITELEKESRDEAIKNNKYYWKIFATLNNVEPIKNSFLMRASNDESKIQFLQPNTTTINLLLIYETFYAYRDKLAGDSEKDIKLSKAALSRIFRIRGICNFCTNVNESYMFDSLSEPTRSPKYTGRAYMVNNSNWTPYLETLLTHNGQNMNFFFYETKETVNFWIYTVVWAIISIGLMGAGIVIYNKYDIK